MHAMRRFVAPVIGHPSVTDLRRVLLRIALILLAGATVLTRPSIARGVTVISQAGNVDVYLGMPSTQLEFENPLTGTETVRNYSILEWRDADYAPGPPPWYDDFSVNNPASIDGFPTEIWLRQNADSMWTNTTVPSTIVGVHMTGDSNDGLARVVVDGLEVARLDMGTQPVSQTALIIVRGLTFQPHTIQIDDLGMGPSNLGDDVHAFGVSALRRNSFVKWNQPPQPAQAGNIFNGWNEWSLYEGPQIVADDWVCNTNAPVTKIRWWGSFANWTQPIPPPFQPSAFQFAIWTDIPSPPEPFSHPLQVVWTYATPGPVVPTFYGWDFDPRTQRFEACFLFEVDLPAANYFYQEPDPSPHIYWLSIAAQYPIPNPTEAWGWKTRPRDATSPAPDDAVRIFSPTMPQVGMLWGGGMPLFFPTPNESWDCAFELVSAPTETSVKWSQPPVLPGIPPYPQCFNGWDKRSVYQYGPIIADDWICADSRPVSDIHWWGSYMNWDASTPPPMAPDSFQLAIWTDVPANPPNVPFSHPGVVKWVKTIARNATNETYVGCDFYPQAGAVPDACFRYDITLAVSEFFQQEPAPTQNIYWLSIAAVYSAPPMANIWGWKTRPMGMSPAPDTAVQISNPLMPAFGSSYVAGTRVELPAGNYWDMAFELTSVESEPAIVKWSQPPVPVVRPDFYNGWNEYSRFGDVQIAADDWVCTTDQPVTDVHWWGSFKDWLEPVPPPDMPNTFYLSIWTDAPSQPGQFSHPGEVIWQNYCSSFSWEFVGWDIDPRDPLAPPEACFKFTQDLDPADWFWQEPGGNIYWLSIAATYDTTVPIHPFGWKTVPHPDGQSPDDAVRIFAPTAPTLHMPYLLGEEIITPDGQSWDLAFALTTDSPPRTAKWSQLPHGPLQGFDAASSLWVPGLGVNRVVADDFVSDGRTIKAVRWWGSYLDSRYEPYELDPLRQVDGWLISFHWADDGSANVTCPPDVATDPGIVNGTLALYFAPASAVHIVPTGMPDCFGQTVYQYQIDLANCCLLCTMPDPRSGLIPGMPDRFAEEAMSRYWLDIQAVVGVTWLPPACVFQLTGHIPSDLNPDGQFWGWHTSPGPVGGLCGYLDTACVGQIVGFMGMPPNCWTYGNWIKQPWLCPFPPLPTNVHMAFELLTEDPAVMLPPFIIRQPVNARACVGSTASFRVEACGTPLLNYQWWKVGPPPVLIPGATQPTYTISPVALADAGSYFCDLNNAWGNLKTIPVSLSVTPQGSGDVNYDGATDGQDIQLFVDVLIGGDVDPSHVCACDMNGDGTVDTVTDPGLFVAKLLGP